ncbi:MAG: hypothetical protein HY784_01870, partial [Chloroflexi bacterium]|nr:hypothetical protein [Chloroflexota bacterium]
MRHIARLALGMLLGLAACAAPTLEPSATPAPTPTHTRVPFTPRPTITPLPDKIPGLWPPNWRLLVLDRRGRLLRVDPLATSRVVDAQKNFAAPAVGLALSADRTRAFVTQFTDKPGQDAIAVINLTDGATLAEISAADGTNFIHPLPDGRLLAGSKYAGLMQVVDPDRLEITRAYDLGVRGGLDTGADNFTVTGDGMVYVPLRKDPQSIAVLTLSSGAVRTLPQPGAPDLRAVLPSPDGKTLLALDAGGEQLLVLDPASGAQLGTVKLCGGVITLAPTPDGRKAYVYCPDVFSVAVVDLTIPAVKSTLLLGQFGIGAWINVDPEGRFVYVGGYGVLFILDAQSDEMLSAIPMPSQIPGMFGLERV